MFGVASCRRSSCIEVGGRGVWGARVVARGRGAAVSVEARAREHVASRLCGAAAECDASAPPAMATLGLSKVFILDKYFTELQKFWETEKKLQGERATIPAPHLTSLLAPAIVMIITFFVFSVESFAYSFSECRMSSEKIRRESGWKEGRPRLVAVFVKFHHASS